ncbi:hypothetical protein D3C87_82730 [compost metagenome]
MTWRSFTMIFCVIALIFIVSCGPADYAKEGSVTVESSEPIVNYVEKIPNRLYYIPHEDNKADFPAKYNALLTEHPELRVFNVETVIREAVNVNAIEGYFIFTEEK